MLRAAYTPSLNVNRTVLLIIVATLWCAAPSQADDQFPVSEALAPSPQLCPPSLRAPADTIRLPQYPNTAYRSRHSHRWQHHFNPYHNSQLAPQVPHSYLRPDLTRQPTSITRWWH